MKFSDLKRIINEMDETVWGDTVIEINDDTRGTFGHNSQGYIVDLSTTSGLPPAPEGSSAARWYGTSPGEKPKLILQFVDTTR